MQISEMRLYLIKYLLGENQRYINMEIPKSEQEQKNLLRSLFNVRPPHTVSDEFLKIQDEYLKAEVLSRGIVDINTLMPTAFSDKIYLWQGDITRLNADAIVNAANSALLGCFQPMHNCIDNIIHTLSGVRLRLDCNELMEKQGHEEETGEAKITPAYNLPSKYVLHTVGPIISGKLTDKDKKLLANCYNSCMEVAVKNDVKSIAFCCISTGVFCFPKEQAAEIAVKTVFEFLQNNHRDIKLIFNVFMDKDLEIYQNLLNK